MPFYPSVVASELEAEVDTIEEYVDQDEAVVERYQRVLLETHASMSADDVRDTLADESYPGALPIGKFDEHDELIVRLEASRDWASHEAVNDWAQDILERVTTIATDGSELGPTTEFTVPLGLVQAAWCANHHDQDGDVERDIRTELLTPADVSYQDPDSETRYVDEREPARARYEHEGEVVVDCIRDYAALDPPPVVFYDGPLQVSFANTYERDDRRRYIETMSRILAASEHYEVPVVGYVSGSAAIDLVRMLRGFAPDDLEDEPKVPDVRVVEPLMEPWGDRTLLFQTRRDRSIDDLETTFEGVDYDFGDDLLFTYVNIPGPGAVDRIELPRWIVDAGLEEYVLDIVRAEAAIGRGYPEIIQQADTDAVLTTDDRREFLRLIQRFADEHDIDIEWDPKELSKTRRRR